MDQRRIIMNFSRPPGFEEIENIAREVCDSLPEELLRYCENLTVQVENIPDESIESELDLDDIYDLVALYRSGKEIAPGVLKKGGSEEGVLVLYRRPILDLWCEMEEDLTLVMREIIIEELARNFDFSEEEIEEMASRHHQGLF